jgi:uncharacterized protein
MWENVALSVVLHTLWIGAALAAIAELLGIPPGEGIHAIAGYVIIAAAIAWCTASALMFEGVSGQTVLPVGMTKQAQQEPAIATGEGEPGVAKGQ